MTTRAFSGVIVRCHDLVELPQAFGQTARTIGCLFGPWNFRIDPALKPVLDLDTPVWFGLVGVSREVPVSASLDHTGLPAPFDPRAGTVMPRRGAHPERARLPSGLNPTKPCERGRCVTVAETVSV